MQFETSNLSLAAVRADCIAIGLHDDGTLAPLAKQVDEACGGRLKQLQARGDLPTRLGETLLLLDLPGLKAERVIVVGLGSPGDFDRRAWRKALSAVLTAVLRTRTLRLALALERPAADRKPGGDYYFGRAVAELTHAALYRTNDFKSARKPKPPALTRVLTAAVATE